MFKTHLLFLFSTFSSFLCNNFTKILVPEYFDLSTYIFAFEGIDYIFYNNRATWREGQIVCSSTKGYSFAIVDSDEKAAFLAEALSDTDFDMEHFWVGAFRKNCTESTSKNKTCYVWLNDKQVDHKYILYKTNLATSKDTSRKNDCLSFSRSFHNDPVLIGLNCNLSKPLICQRPSKGLPGERTHNYKWITLGDRDYSVFFDEKTWHESVTECYKKDRAAHLVNFRNVEEVRAIASVLLIDRPNMEKAWIGGHLYDETDTKNIVRRTNLRELINFNKRHLNVNTQTNYERRCMTLDRHMVGTDKIAFVMMHCEHLHGYICAKPNNNTKAAIEIVQNDNFIFIVYYQTASWHDAYEICRDNNTNLVEVTSDKIDTIINIMGENSEEIHHIWIGGKLKADKTWHWVNSNNSIPSKENFKTGYPPWLDFPFEIEYSCLNLDRENHLRAMFYGVDCNAAQPFICETTMKVT